jgi:hypothetical protein
MASPTSLPSPSATQHSRCLALPPWSGGQYNREGNGTEDPAIASLAGLQSKVANLKNTTAKKTGA